MTCPFCELKIKKEREIYESELSWAFPTNIPITVGHTLVIPKRCIAKIEDLTEEELLDLFELVDKVKQSLKKTFKSEGFNFAWNEGEMAGQSVPHLHIHIVPRTAGDQGIYKYEPRKFLYRPGSREETPQKELIKIAKLIAKNIV